MTTNSKSLLAKLLATEDIKIRRNPAARTASFDVKHRVLEMPIWKGVSEDLEDMLTVHETGHALDTPPDGWLEAIDSIVNKHHDKPSGRQKKAVHGFLNVIEDARIDKRQKRRYPGSRRNYIVGYKELIERGFFGPPNKDLNTYSFIDRVNMYFKGGFASGIKFSPEEMPFVRRIEAAETFADVIAMTDEVYGFAKERGEEEAEQQALPDMNMDDMDMEDMDFDDDMRDSSGSSYDDDGEEESDDDSDDSDDSDDQGDQGDQGEGDISAQDKEKPDGVNGQDPRDMMDHDNGEYTPESETDNVWQEKQLELSDTSTEYVYVTTPKPILNRIVDDYKVFLAENEEHFSSLPYTYGTVQEFITKDFMDFKMKENNTISFMVKEFEMRKAADLYSRISISKTGVIDTNKLHSYKYNDDIFRRLSVLPQGKNHGFVMFLDWSGSMCDNIKATVKQLVGLVLFCKRVQIPFEVYIFRNLNNMSKEQYTANEPFFEYKETDMVFTPFKIRNILSSRMSITELGRAFNILWTLSNKGSQVEPMGNTPLNGAIVVATDLVNQFRARNKVQVVNTIFLTDGDSDMILGIHGEVKTFTPTPLPEHIKSRKYVLVDEQTKREYYLTDRFNVQTRYSSVYNISGQNLTQNLLKLLKARTDTNLIGFYLYSAYARGYGSRAKNAYYYFFGNPSNQKHFDDHIKMWTDNKFFPVTTHGYDEYYIIDAISMRQTNNELDIDSSMTKGKIAKEFLKFSSKKAVNRVLLQRFITSIASNKQAA